MKAKKSVAIVMALLLMLSVCSSMVFAAGVSEGYSSGFEDGGIGWLYHTVVKPEDKATAAEGTIQKTADAYEGVNYAVLKNNVRTISPEVTVEPGKDYEISIAYNATSETTLAFFYYQYTAAGTQILLEPIGQTFNNDGSIGKTTVANTWTVFKVRTGEIAADTRKVQIQALCWADNRVAIDAFSVRECSWENFQGVGNAGFETGVTGWTSDNVTIKSKTEVTDIVEGQYCASIAAGKDATGPDIPVLPGKSYRLNFYFKTGTSGCSFYYGIGSAANDSNLAPANNEWQVYTWDTGVIPEGGYALKIRFRPWSDTYFDGFRLFELSETVTDALEGGDFEDGITSFNRVGATEETEIIHNGAKSLKLEGTADTPAYAEKNFIALSGRAYTATAYFKATALSGDGAKLSVVNGKTGAQVAATDYVKRTSGAWRKMTVSIPSTAPSWLRLKVEVVGQGTVYFDDIRVFEGADSGTAAYDGTFENGLDGFEVENALVSSASGTVHAGAKSAKLTATAEAPASIAASTTIEAGKSYYVTAYFKAASLPAGDGEGAKLSVVNDLTGEVITALANVTGDPQPSITTTTEFFKTKTDTWRKMMVCIPTSNVVTTILVKAELVGEGEVYFDDIQVEQTDDLVFNGDFEGLTSDTKLAGGYDMRTTQIDSTKGQGNSIKITTKGLINGIQIPLPRTGTSTICRLSFDYYTNNSAYPATYISEISRPENTGTYYGLLSNNLKTNEWGHHEFYYRGGDGYFDRFGALSLDASNMFPGSSDTQFVYYDNVKIEVVCANADLTGGKRFETMSFSKETVSPGDTITATYSEMNPDYATAEGRQVTALFGIYKKVKEGVWALVGAKTASGKAPKATNFNGNYSTPTDYSAHGISPLQLTAELSIPQDAGEYGIKAFVWDSTETREPLLDPYTLNMN